MAMNKFDKLGAILTAPATLTQSSLLDSTGGSASGSFNMVACDSSKVNNNFATLLVQMAAIKVDVAAVRTVVANLVTKLNKANS